MNVISTFTFYTLEVRNMDPPSLEYLPLKGDTVIGNDVWLGQNAVVIPSVHVGEGAIIGASSVVASVVSRRILTVVASQERM